MAPPTFTTVLTPEYTARREALRDPFPAAHAFLAALEALGDGGGRFHLGTAQNLHLYDGATFLCYVRIERRGTGRPSLVFSSEPHQGKIKDGTQAIEAPEFLRLVIRRIREHEGFHRWAVKEGAGIVLSADTPAALFDALLADLRAR